MTSSGDGRDRGKKKDDRQSCLQHAVGHRMGNDVMRGMAAMMFHLVRPLQYFVLLLSRGSLDAYFSARGKKGACRDQDEEIENLVHSLVFSFVGDAACAKSFSHGDGHGPALPAACEAQGVAL